MALFAGRRPSGRGLGRRALWAVVPGLLLLLGLAAFFKPPPSGADLQPPAAPLGNDALQLLGLRARVRDARYLEVYPYWLVRETPPDLRVDWRLLGADGASYAVGGGRPYFKAMDAANWSPNTLVDDAYQLALPEGGLRVGDVFTLTVQYKARPGDNPTPDYTQFVHLHDPALGMAAQRDSQPLNGGNPTSSWVDGEVIVDEIPLQVSEEAAPGSYRLLFGLYDAQAGGARVPVYGVDGERLEDDQVVLAELKVSGVENGAD